MSDRYDPDDHYEPDPRRHRDPRASRRQAQPPTSGEGVRILGSEDDEEPDDGRLAPDEPRYGDVPPRPDPDVRPAARFPLPEDDDFDAWGDEEGPTWSASSQGATDAGAEEGSGPVDLPHWTEPPTGEVPRIFADADREPVPDDDLDSWSSISGSTPRFRSEAGDWAEGDFPGSLKDEDVAVGALADETLPVDEDAEFDERVAARRRGRGRQPAPPPPPEGRPLPRRGSLETGEELPAPVAGEEAQVDITTRVVTAVGIAVVALVMLALGRGPATLLVMAIVGLAAFELYVGFQRAGYQPATILGLLGCVSVVWIAYKEGLQAFPLVGALVVVFTLLWYMAEVVKARPIINTAMTFFGFLYIGVLGGFAGLLLQSRDGTGLLIGLAICAVGYDVFGYFIGSQFGRSRMAPRLSPNKTWEGLFGGMAAAVVLGAIVSKGISLAPWDGKLSHGLALGVVVAIMAPIGDLCESMIKRDLGVKDLGTILPGHGGILDRFDAILFCLPAVYYLVVQLNIG
ncbi:MAG TPA: phosphatidate cytidylyltransferase [Acidimicrobiia bacterium]